MILLATVWHTGTQYVMQHLLQGAVQIHCNHPNLWPTIEENDGGLEIYTTVRDPFLVAASWGNQYPSPAEVEQEWFGQWDDWGRIMAMGPDVFDVAEFDQPKVGSKPDRKNLHHHLARERYDKFYEVVPPHWVTYAQNIQRRYLP